ncbi:hypothetical protein ACLMJK_004030 [Lecanora helva]
MATGFWNSWQLWEKLCFVLACGIVFVVLLGCLKLAYNHWRLRRYTKIDAAKAAIKQEMQYSQSVRQRRADRVPFGVRAIESGIEVDGVWISRSNTPVSSLPGSPALSGTTFKQTAPRLDESLGRASIGSDMTRIEISGPSQEHINTGEASASSSSRPSPFGHPTRKHQPPPTSDHQARGRPTYQPRRSSGLRYSDSLNTEDPESLSVSTMDDLVQREGSGTESEGVRPSTSASASSSVSRNEDTRPTTPKPGTEPQTHGLLYPSYQNPPNGHRVISHGITGSNMNNKVQVSSLNEQSRVEASRLGAEVANVHTYEYGAGSNNIYTPSHQIDNPFATPLRTPIDEHGTMMMDNDIADQHAKLMDNSEIDYHHGHKQPLQPFEGHRQLRRSQVIRKINSGFEILRPGTLKSSGQDNEGIELANSNQGDGKRESKKLQKRGRASSKSSYTLER